MKKIFLLLIILFGTLFLGNLTFAEKGTDIGLSMEVDKLVGYIESRPYYAGGITLVSEKIRMYKDVVDMLNGKIQALSSQTNIQPTNNTCQKISQTLWEGNSQQNSSGDVTRLQQFLSDRYSTYFTCPPTASCSGPQPVTGVYDAWTTGNVRYFQKAYGIRQTGAVGPLTLAKINSMICK